MSLKQCIRILLIFPGIRIRRRINFILKVRQMIAPNAPNGFIYVFQLVPDLDKFYGSDLFPDTFGIASFLARYFEKQYVSSTYAVNAKKMAGNYSKDKYLRCFWI